MTISPSAPVHSNPFAVITGASRGIGAAYARALAEAGYELLLVSRDGERLALLSRELTQRFRTTAHTEILDLVRPDAAQRLYQASRQRREQTDLVVNNAGFGWYGAFAAMPMERIREMLQVHLAATVESVRLFLPDMLAQGRGAIINVASIAGFYSIPYLAEYAATKAFLISFSEAVDAEVRHKGVRIQACCPGSTSTDFHRTAGLQPVSPFSADSAEAVVAASLRALPSGPSVVTIGLKGLGQAWVSRWMPRAVVLRAAARWMQRAMGKRP
jgi:short-subunit dehydrogenase